MRVTDEELRSLERAFMDANPPDAAVQLQWLRPTILNFFRDGYSKKLTFQFLKNADLVRCSQATFYRWVSKNMDFAAEAGAPPSDIPGVPFLEKAKLGGTVAQVTCSSENPKANALPGSPPPADANAALVGDERFRRRNEGKGLSNEERRRLIASLDETLSEMERGSPGATFDRVQARLDKRDREAPK